MTHVPGSVIHVFIKEKVDEKDCNLIGYYDTNHLRKLQRDVQPHSGKATGIYYGLNPVSPACLNRATNCLLPVTQAASATNSDVHHRSLMLIDIDPVRDANCSSTEEDKNNAYLLTQAVEKDLRIAGWPKPIAVDSGNGYHLLYRIDLPADDKGLIRSCLRALAQKHDGKEAKVDTVVHDARRIAKLPGTMACKGEPTNERPHRTSGFFKLPTEFKTVPVQLLRELANQASTMTAAKLMPSPPKNPKPIRVTNESKQVRNARAYLAKVDPAIEGQHGHNQFLNAACRLVDDFALSREQAQPLLEEYNQRCLPPFNQNDFDRKLDAAILKVAERGGPSGELLADDVQTPTTKTTFVGYVPDFGLTDQQVVMMPNTAKLFNGFWIQYWQLWQHLRSDALVPDTMLRQLHYGANYDQNWKKRITTKTALKPINTANCTAATCMLHGSETKHGHYRGSLKTHWVLDTFCLEELKQPGRTRIFDVYGEAHAERFRKLRDQGKLTNVYWPALVLGSSRKVGWTWQQQRMLVGIVQELTRVKRRRGDDFTPGVIHDALVPTSGNAAHLTACPVLDPSRQYVVFAGNKSRHGRGYQLVGRKGKGWIYKTGYLNALTMPLNERHDAIRSFLLDLQSLAADLGLVPAAICQGEWKNLNELLDCLKTGYGRDWLDGCTLRIYTSIDWRIRWRQFFSDKLGFEWIPAASDDPANQNPLNADGKRSRITTATQLEQLLDENRWTHEQLANAIADVTGKPCSRTRVQRHLYGTRNTKGFFDAVNLIRFDTQTRLLPLAHIYPSIATP